MPSAVSPSHHVVEDLGSSAVEITQVLQAVALASSQPRLVHGFTGGLPRIDEQIQASALAGWLRRSGARRLPPVVLMSQPHGVAIAEVSVSQAALDAGAAVVVPEVDGAEAAGPRTAVLVVKSADCVPILAFDPELDRCAGLHAGWRGVAAGILPRLLERWRGRGSSLRQLRLAFGPHIRQCCFEVRQDCVDKFQPGDLTGTMETRGPSRYLSLERVLRTQAALYDVAAAQIEALPHCTDCHRSTDGQSLFASYRRASREGRAAGRNLSFIALLPEGAAQP